MIDKIENIPIQDQIDIQIIPKLKDFNIVTLNPGDTLVAYYNKKHYTLNDVHEIYELLHNTFPNNNILCLAKDIELGVIKEE